MAHELFHVLTWHVFRHTSDEASDLEDKLANAFASRLLMPEESIKARIKRGLDDQNQITFGQLDDIARECDVSLLALIYRLASILRQKKDDTSKDIDAAQRYLGIAKRRPSFEPPKLPERYCDLAIRALRGGRLSAMQFAKYMKHMGMTFRKAQEYLTDDEDFMDEEVSIPIA
ncbi:MAG: ImmA/IrrE family metallo-endopeptidase [Planctomycetota bacterium]